MTGISAKKGFNKTKRISTIYFGIVFLFILIGIRIVYEGNGSLFSLIFLIVPTFMAVAGYFIMKQLVFDLVDEAYDEGSTLLFKKSGNEVRVKLSDIKNVSFQMSSPPRITLSLRIDTVLGSEIAFSPPTSFNPFKKPAIVTELIDRIDKANGH